MLDSASILNSSLHIFLSQGKYCICYASIVTLNCKSMNVKVDTRVLSIVYSWYTIFPDWFPSEFDCKKLRVQNSASGLSKFKVRISPSELANKDVLLSGEYKLPFSVFFVSSFRSQ